MRLRIAENFEALFYAPLYALRALGFAEQEGLAIEWLPPGAPGGAIDAVRAAEVDVTWGGPMRVMRDRDTLPLDGASLVCFGEAVGRDPFMLLMRREPGASRERGFDLAQLGEMRWSVVAEVPTPWHCLQQDLRDRSIDPARLLAEGRVVQGRSMPSQIDALMAGSVDAIQLFEPYASALERAESAEVVYAASGRGPCCYTTFITSRAAMAQHRTAMAALVRALARTQSWIAQSGPDALAQVIGPRLPEIHPTDLRAAVSRYQAAGVWSAHPQISRAGIARLGACLQAGGFVTSAAAYDDIVVEP
jgi:NitT/TauT family transport system substrate-binding protein